MEYAYIGSNLISFALWLFLYLRRKDLRQMMLVMSFCAMPLAVFDLVFVPAYWVPITLFNIPVGIEGFLFSFSVGGVASVLYAEITRRTVRRIPARQPINKGIWVPLISFVAFLVAYGLGVPNPEIAAYIAIAAGILLTLVMRPDLIKSALIGAICFGVVYFLALKLWVVLFPDVQGWFAFLGLPQVFIWDVPGWEVLFGFFFGAYWTNLYEVLFGYRLVPVKH